MPGSHALRTPPPMMKEAEGPGALPVQQLTALIEASRQGYALFDGHDRLHYANPAFRELLGLASDELPLWEDLMRTGYLSSTGTMVATDDFEAWLRSAKSRRGKLPYRTIETSLSDGRWVLTTETTLPGGWMLCVVTDVSELGVGLRDLRQERDRALKSALSDELTGLGNRRYAMDFLNQKLGPSKAQAMVVAILDIDHFKAVNDRFGHPGGDLVLKDFAAQLALAAGRDDLAGRIGGEEFLLVLLGRDLAQAEDVLRRLLVAVSGRAPLSDAPDFRYSCSAGGALVRPGETASEVLRRADQALYQAKHGGRNRVVLYQEPACPPHSGAGQAGATGG